MAQRVIRAGLFGEVMAERLAHRFGSLGMTQLELARLTGIDRKRLRGILSARRTMTVDEFELIATALGTSAGDLLTECERWAASLWKNSDDSLGEMRKLAELPPAADDHSEFLEEIVDKDLDLTGMSMPAPPTRFTPLPHLEDYAIPAKGTHQ